MKTPIKILIVSVLALASLGLGACSSMPESHREGMQTHEMGSPSKSNSMGNSMMPDGR